MFALIKNGVVQTYPYSITDLKRQNPNVSFPDTVSDATLSEFDVQRVFFTVQPEITQTQNLKELTPVFNEETQRWDQVWSVVDKTEEEIQAVANSVRSSRDAEIAKSDWRVIKALETGTPVSSDWATYRQALRDITAQPGFPWDINWPVEPK